MASAIAAPLIAVPLERRPDERRVALVPPLLERLLALGVRLRVEAGAARSAGFHDDAWPTGRVEIVEGFAATVADADLVLKVAPPTIEEARALAPGTVLVALMSAFQHLDVVEVLRERHITTLAMDLIPRRTRARSMNAVASQATVAGYKAALLAAALSPRLFPMLTTAAGTVQPARVVVIGAGVAGLQAIATVRRLGARAEAYDIRGAARERIESLGATMIDTGVVAEGPDGLARALRRDELERQHAVLRDHFARAHAVICAASIPGRPAPRIVSQELVECMLPDTVIVDLAANTGGNCELTRAGRQVQHGDVLIAGPLNLPSHGAVHASEMYARNVVNFLELVIVDGALRLDPGDEIVARTVLTHRGSVHHLPTAGLLGVPSVAFGEIERHPAAGALAAAARDASDAPTRAQTSTGRPSVSRPGTPPVKSAAAGAGSVDEDGSEDGWLADSDPTELASGEDRNAPAGVASRASPEPASGGDGERRGPLDGAVRKDDFTRIDGIGPALQRRLRDFGFTRYADLAALDGAQIERLALQLELDDEIESGDWVGQARRLMVASGDAGRSAT